MDIDGHWLACAWTLMVIDGYQQPCPCWLNNFPPLVALLMKRSITVRLCSAMPAIIVIAHMENGRVFPMLVEQGQILKVAGAVDAQNIANDIDKQTLERMTKNQLYSFTSALGYLPGEIPQDPTLFGRPKSKADIVRFLLAKWSEFFEKKGEDEVFEYDEDPAPLTSDEHSEDEDGTYPRGIRPSTAAFEDRNPTPTGTVTDDEQFYEKGAEDC